jgi:hypothetical protein
MKTKSLIISMIFLIIKFASYGQQTQSESDEKFDYETKDETFFYKYDFTNTKPVKPKAKFVAHDGLRFYIIPGLREDTDFGKYYIARFYAINPKEPDAFKQDKTIINSANSNEYYCINADDFQNKDVITKRYATGFGNVKLNIGILAIPFKIRPKNNNNPADYSGDFTLGNTIGVSFRISHYHANYLNFSVAGGLASVNVDANSTNGFVSESTKWGALSSGLAMTFDFNGFQIGGVMGSDFVGGNPGSHWIYNNNFWYSIGIGYQFIKPKDDKQNK